MRLKSFIAANVPAAMKLVREQLGPDAVILSTQKEGTDGWVKVTAALEDSSLDELLWPDEPEGVDILDTLGQALDYHRIPAGLADRLMAAAGDAATGDPATALAAALDEVLSFGPPPLPRSGRPVMLIGPPGCGKTATAAKLCAQARLAGQGSRLITMDTLKAGALAQATTYANALNARLDQAADTGYLQQLLRDKPCKDPTVIDTAGCNPLDRAERQRLGDAAHAVGADLTLVMAAGGDVLEAAECALAFAEVGASALIATRLDATRRLGAVLSAADVGRLGLAAAGVSPSIGDGLVRVHPVTLARLILPDARAQAAPATLATGTL